MVVSSNSTADGDELDSLNQCTGAHTLVISLTYDPAFGGAAESRANGMKFDPSTGTLYASVVNGDNPSQVWSLGTMNISTGAVTRIGKTVDGLDAIALSGQGSIRSF